VLSRTAPAAGDTTRVTLTPPVPVAVPAVVDAAASASAAVVATPPVPDTAASQAMVETVFSAPPADASASAAAVAGILQLRCTEESWVEVRDARGQSLLSRNVQPGESVGLDGALPLRVTIGNAAATQLAFRGQPVNLASRTRDNVARLELP
jgi:cytoskeleton protein RodZ